MTKLTRVEEEDSDRDNPFRPGSQLDREAASILRGSHISRNSIQLGSCVISETGNGSKNMDSTLADSGVDGVDSLPIVDAQLATPGPGDQSELILQQQQQPRRNSKGHVRIKEDTVIVLSPDTEVTTAVILDEGGEDEADDGNDVNKDLSGDKDVHEVKVSSPAIVNGHGSLLATNSSLSKAPDSTLDSTAATADMVEVQVFSATLNAAAPSIAEAVSLDDKKPAKCQRKLSANGAKQKIEDGGRDKVGAKKACCVVM